MVFGAMRKYKILNSTYSTLIGLALL